MKAMILAAGRGERMRPLTDTIPKPLLKVAGKPLIVHHLQRLAQAGLTEIVINVAHLGEQIKNTLHDGHAYGVHIEYSDESAHVGGLETAGGIIQALPLLGNDPFLVVNADVFTDYPFAQLTTRTMQQTAHLVLVPNPIQHPQGDFSMEAGLLVEKNTHKSYTVAGISLYHPAFFAGLLPGKRRLPVLWESAIAMREMTAEVYEGMWHDIGTPERLKEANERVLIL